MKISRFVGFYSQALAWVGAALLIAVLVADHRWLGQIPEMAVLFGSAVALRGLAVPLSKYSYLTQTALVGLTGSLLVGVPATALAIAGATTITDWVWQRKPLRVAWATEVAVISWAMAKGRSWPLTPRSPTARWRTRSSSTAQRDPAPARIQAPRYSPRHSRRPRSAD